VEKARRPPGRTTSWGVKADQRKINSGGREPQRDKSAVHTILNLPKRTKRIRRGGANEK